MRIKLSLALTLNGCLLTAWLAIGQPAPSQSTSALPLRDLAAFRTPTSANWRIVGDVNADLSKPNTLLATAGANVLVCQPVGQYGQQYNLLTNVEHADVDLELDFMLAKGANSGVYLQGRYEVQLMDSWGVLNPKSTDVGAIYERWDEQRPDGQKGYEGHPARQNAGKAPGLWQHLKISFQAPRFGPNGQKTANARFIRVELNGVVVQENLDVTGPTRSAAFTDERPRGPLMLQGDHGAVAFRNITYQLFDNARPRLSNLTYALYKGAYKDAPNLATMPPEANGPSAILSAGVSRLPNEFVLKYTGTLHIDQPGEYTFRTNTRGGAGQVRINNQPVNPWREWSNEGKISLPAGDLPFEATYSKYVEWVKTGLELSGEGPGVRQFTLTPTDMGSDEETDPILVTAETNTILRSFMDLPYVKTEKGGTHRVTHAISVGSPQQVHYTYDADNGSVVQVWRGDFLDTTPMWEGRGDGSSRPNGSVTYLGATPRLMLARLPSAQAAWPTDTLGSQFRPKGYQLDEQDRPTFTYMTSGAVVTDQLRPLPENQGLRREITISQPVAGLYARLASGSNIETTANNTYLIDGKKYMIQLLEAGGSQPIVRSANGQQELLVPVTSKLTYSILF